MTESRVGHSYGQILRSSSLMAGASVITVLMGIVKMKVLAVLLGAGGLGLVSLLSSVLTTGATVAGLGVNSSGVRELAVVSSDSIQARLTRQSLWFANLALGAIGFALLALLRKPLAILVFGDEAFSGQVFWIGCGVFLALVAGSQMAYLQGMRLIRSYALARVLASVLGAILAIVAVLAWGRTALILFVLASPVAGVVTATIVVRKIAGGMGGWSNLGQIVAKWRSMIGLGSMMMLSGISVNLVLLAVRSTIISEEGVAAAGHFQAAWQLSMTYLTFVLGAMAADYFPRLTEAIDDRELAEQLVNEQTEIALLLAGPVILALLGLAPWLVPLLYSSEFGDSVAILRWQMLGDVLKLASWPLGFILLAQSRGGLFLGVQTLVYGCYFLAISIGLPIFGMTVTGTAFFLMYLLYYLLMLVLTRYLAGMRVLRSNIKHLSMLLVSAALIVVVAGETPRVGLLLAVVLTAAFGYFGLKRLDQMELGGKLGRLVSALSSWFCHG